MGDIVKMYLEKLDGRNKDRIKLKLLWALWWTFRFGKMRGISWLAEELLAYHEGLYSMEY